VRDDEKMTEFAMAGDGVRLAWETVGSGPSILLIHGFASSRIQNWKQPGWYQTLTEAGYSVIAMDCRGHGESDKPHDPAAYGHDTMAEDAIRVLAAAGAGPVFLMGYSMGGFIGLHLLLGRPELVRRLAIGGVGATYLQPAEGVPDRMADPAVRGRIADALLVDDPNGIADPTAKTFRTFADQGGKDRRALAACMRAMRRNYGAAELRKSTRPVLVVCGEKDHMAGPPGPLAAAFADGRSVSVPRRDHMTAVGDKVYKEAVIAFFSEE
jgi:pimeloyl-ACP methyl ester carboxylesterase